MNQGNGKIEGILLKMENVTLIELHFHTLEVR